MLCIILKLFCLLFELHFLIHFVPFMHHYPYLYLLFFPSFFLAPLSICVKKGESILESIPKSFDISIWLLCTFLEGEIIFLVHILRVRNSKGRCIYQGGEDFVVWENLDCFLIFFMVLWTSFSFYALLFSSHRVCVWTCIYPYAIVLYWLHFRMIIWFAMWSL